MRPQREIRSRFLSDELARRPEPARAAVCAAPELVLVAALRRAVVQAVPEAVNNAAPAAPVTCTAAKRSAVAARVAASARAERTARRSDAALVLDVLWEQSAPNQLLK